MTRQTRTAVTQQHAQRPKKAARLAPELLAAEPAAGASRLGGCRAASSEAFRAACAAAFFWAASWARMDASSFSARRCTCVGTGNRNLRSAPVALHRATSFLNCPG